jgi:hypothetical protein
MVQFGSSFRFFKEQQRDTFQNSVAHCMSLAIRHASADGKAGGSDFEFETWADGGFRVCYDRELMAINRFMATRNGQPLDGDFWSGNVQEQDDNSDDAEFRINACKFTAGKWSAFIASGAAVAVVDDEDDADIDLEFNYFCCSSRNDKADAPEGIIGENSRK